MDWPNGSMLAEPRYRVKASQDPNGTAWAKDETKFGKRMLEKMGWSKGKGLGAKEDGMKEHVKVATKNNTRGLGCSAKQADYWTEHQDGFNALLQNLNKTCSASNSPAGSDSESGKVSNLEHLSKNSKARVHYQKFTKGKDLSSRSEKDLACIFGYKGKKSKREAEEEDAPDKTPDRKKTDGETMDTSHGVVTIQNKLSVQEYFKLKMAERLQKGSGGVAGTSTPDSCSSSKSSSPEPSCSQSPALDAAVDALATESKKTKKPKRRKKEEVEESCEQEELSSAETEGTEGGSSKKKKKKKDRQMAGREESCESPDQDMHGSSSSSPPSVSREKKKKKDKRKEMAEETSEIPGLDTSSVTLDGPSTESKKKPKKDKKRKTTDEIFETSDHEMLPISPSSPSSESKKKKKKKKRKSEQEEDVVQEASSEKKKKSVSFAEALVHSVTLDEIDDSMNAHSVEGTATEEDAADLKTSGKKKKKKAKKEKLEKNKDLAIDDSVDERVDAGQETGKTLEELPSASEKTKKKKEKKCRESDNGDNGGVESDTSLNKENAQAKVGIKSKATLSWKRAVGSVEGYSNLKLKH